MDKGYERPDGTWGDQRLDVIEKNSQGLGVLNPAHKEPSSKPSFLKAVGINVASLAITTSIAFGLVAGSLPKADRQLLMDQMRDSISGTHTQGVSPLAPSSSLRPLQRP